MTPERLAEIREMVAALDEPYDTRIGSLASVRLSLYAISNTKDLLAHVDDLTRQLDDARGIAVRSGYFQDDTDNEALCREADEQPAGWPADCGCRLICKSGGTQIETDPKCPRHGRPDCKIVIDLGSGFNSETEIKADARPSAYDMPVGSVVVTKTGRALIYGDKKPTPIDQRTWNT